MTTLHQIGELLRSGVRPTDEETEHLKALGGFVAEMYGRFMGGHAEHLTSAADLWSGRLAGRLSAATGARWEQGLGLAELLLGSELTNFWQIAREGFSEGYEDFGAEMSKLDLYDEEALAPAEVAADEAPRRRRGSLFGAKSKAPAAVRRATQRAGQAPRGEGRRSMFETLRLLEGGAETDATAQPDAGGAQARAERSLTWRDGSVAELAVIKALTSGGLFVGDQIATGAPRAGASRAAAVAVPGRSVKPVYLDGVRIDGRTPALASALARVDAVYGRTPSIGSAGDASLTQSRLGRLTASADYSIDRGLGTGERPVYGFFDAVETTYLNLVDEAPAAAATTDVPAGVARPGRIARARAPQTMPASVQAMRRAEGAARAPAQAGGRAAPATVRAETARGAQLRMAPAMSLGDVVQTGGATLRPFVAGVFGGQQQVGSQQPVALASQVTHLPNGEQAVRVQRGGMTAPRYSVVEAARMQAFAAAAPVGAGAFAQAGSQPGSLASPGAVGPFVGGSPVQRAAFGGGETAPVGIGATASAGVTAIGAAPFTTVAQPGVAARTEGAVGRTSIGGGFVMAPVPAAQAPKQWRLAIDGGADMPLGATFSRHEVFAGERASQQAADVRSMKSDFRSVVSGTGSERPSELAQALDGMVWVTLPTDAETTTPAETLGLTAVPSRRAAMVPAALALRSITGAVAGSKQAMRAADIARSSVSGIVVQPGMVVQPGAVGTQVAGALSAAGAASVGAPARMSPGAAFDVAGATDGGAWPVGLAPRGTEMSVARALRSGFLGQTTQPVVDAGATREIGQAVGLPTTAAFETLAARGIGASAEATLGAPGMISGFGTEGSLGERWLEVAMRSEGVERGLRAARFLEGAVANGGYGHIESERALLSIASEAAVPVAGAVEGQPARARGARRLTAAALGRKGSLAATHGATEMRAATQAPEAARQPASRAQVAQAPSLGEARMAPSLGEARMALSRAVVTAREARAVGSVLSALGSSRTTEQGRATTSAVTSATIAATAEMSMPSLRAIAARGFAQAAGADEPVLGRLVQRMNEVRAEHPMAARWETPSSIVERLAGLAPAERREVARAFAASGWSAPELEMLRIAEPAIAPATDAAAVQAQAMRPGRAGRSARTADVAGASPAAVAETARTARMSRSLARVLTGSEALGGGVGDKQVGAAAGAIAQGQAATWLPLLATGADAKYFGGMAPSVAAAGAARFASLHEAVGDLVKMAEAAVATSDSPVALTARREVLRRALAAESGATPMREAIARALSRLETQAGTTAERDGGVPAIGGRELIGAAADAARITGFDDARIGAAGRSEAALVGQTGEREMQIGGAERTMVGIEREGGLEARIAEALALSTQGPAGARRMMRSTVPQPTKLAPTQARRRGQVDEAALVRDTVQSGRSPERQMRIGDDARRVAALHEETQRGLSLTLGSVMAPEAMLSGLRSPELSEAMRTVSTRQAQYGYDVVPVLTTLADSGIDLEAARSSMSAQVQSARLAKRGIAPLGQVGQAGQASAPGQVRGQTDSSGRLGAPGAMGLAGTRFADAEAIGAASPAGSVMGSRTTTSGFETSLVAERAPEQSLVRMLRESDGIETQPGLVSESAPGAAATFARVASSLGRRQRAGLLSAILRGTERAELTALVEQAGGRDFAMAWLNRVDGSRSGLDIGMKETRSEFGQAFGARRDLAMAGDSPISGASFVNTAADDKSGLRSIAASVVHTSTGASRPQHGASQAMRRTDWSFVDTGSKAATPHADLGKLAAAIVGSAESSSRAPMPLVAPAAKAIAQTALRDPTTSSNAAPNNNNSTNSQAAGSKGPVDAKMSEKAIDLLAVEMAGRVARLMGLTQERRGIW